MAKVFKKDVYDFLKIDTTQNFVKALSRTEDLRFENEFTANGKLVKIVRGHHSIQGTWMHRIVAIKFAAWLDPDFEVWVYKTIEEILFAYSREQDQSIYRSVIISHELSQLEKKADKSGEDFEKFIKLKNQEIQERSLRAQATKSRFREFYRDLKPHFQTN